MSKDDLIRDLIQAKAQLCEFKEKRKNVNEEIKRCEEKENNLINALKEVMEAS